MGVGLRVIGPRNLPGRIQPHGRVLRWWLRLRGGRVHLAKLRLLDGLCLLPRLYTQRQGYDEPFYTSDAIGIVRTRGRPVRTVPVDRGAAMRVTSGVLRPGPSDRVEDFQPQSERLGGFVSNPLVSDRTEEPLFTALVAAGLERHDAKHLIDSVNASY
jgi:hypothetical protein